MSRREKGTALLEMIVIGFGTVVVLIPVLLAVVRLGEASDVVGYEARTAAEWVARHGTTPPDPAESEVFVTVEGGLVTAVASMDVDLLGLGDVSVTTEVRSTVAVPIGPYRSDS